MDIQILDITELENGDSGIQFTADPQALEVLASIGLKYLLYCQLLDMSANDVFEYLWNSRSD